MAISLSRCCCFFYLFKIFVYFSSSAWRKMGKSCCLCGLTIFCPLVGCITHCMLRGKVREQKHISGSGCGDLMTVWCCPCCSIIQVANVSFECYQSSKPNIFLFLFLLLGTGCQCFPNGSPLRIDFLIFEFCFEFK